MSKFIDDNRNDLFDNYHSKRDTDFDISHEEIKFVLASDLPGSEIVFDVIIEADYEYLGYSYNDEYENAKTNWFRITCKGDLAKNLQGITIVNTDLYYGKKQISDPLTDSLVPYINQDQLEEVAEKLIEEYYPEALQDPMPIDPCVLAKRMGLTVIEKQITQDLSIFGQIFFANSIATFYDDKSLVKESMFVNGGTILVDPTAYFLRNIGTVNFTVVHECVHWVKHKKSFELERLFNNHASQIQCSVKGGVREKVLGQATDIMEWQANAIAPRILMPRKQTFQKAIDFICLYQDIYETNDTIDVMEFVIDEIATFFGVSRMSAKIRLVELGFEEAVGTFIYIDGHYVRPHAFKKGSLSAEQTFSISLQDVLIESVINERLQEKIKSGHYAFVDSHICINHPEFITTDDTGALRLTDYARHHIDECCLVFDLSFNQAGIGQNYHTECALNRDRDSGISFIAKYNDNPINIEVDEHGKKLFEFGVGMKKVVASLPADFPGTLRKLMDWRHLTDESLAEKSGISSKTISRLATKEDYRSTIETIVAICIGLQLPPFLSSELIGRSSCQLTNSERDWFYRMILSTCYSNSIFEVNNLLQQQNYPPLS